MLVADLMSKIDTFGKRPDSMNRAAIELAIREAIVDSIQSDDALTLLRGIVNSDIGVQIRHKLEEGQSIETEDGKAWLAAIEFVKRSN